MVGQNLLSKERVIYGGGLLKAVVHMGILRILHIFSTLNTPYYKYHNSNNACSSYFNM